MAREMAAARMPPGCMERRGRMGGIGIVTIKSRHTLEMGIMGLMGEVGRDGGGKNAAGVHGGEGWGIEYDRWMIFSDLYTKQSRC